ncbi:MAG: hypothetical protein IJD55_06085 [Clostridia bacterium]|nr:hypothetical protein [Clostridia bacterium]
MKTFRKIILSVVLLFCVLFGLLATAKAYESIRRVAFGEYRKAIEIQKDKIYIFDFEITL